ncbi:MAG TPA: zinc-ribbon domain-containing protein [Xanthobacteraceae bacterium]|nr:zinc-ribbon domain-containing protein [Xanthobacteraceae bacterium]
MLIVCPSCATSYDVEPASLEPMGRRVRCVRCRTVWHVALNHADRLIAAAEALGSAPDAEPSAAAGAEGDDVAAEVAAGMEGQAGPFDHAPDSELADVDPPNILADGLDPQSPWSVDAGDPSSEPIEVEAPSIAPVDLDAGGAPIDGDDATASSGPAQDDIESYAARFSRRGAKRGVWQWSLSRLQTAILALLVVDCILVGWRKDIVRVLPQTASLYAAIGLPVNVRGLSFDQVATSMEAHEGVPILVVQGNIVNDTGAEIDVPRLKLAVRNAAKQEVYSWTVAPSQARLPAYHAIGFRARLASPPPEGRDVLIRFLTRRDIVADTR